MKESVACQYHLAEVRPGARLRILHARVSLRLGGDEFAVVLAGHDLSMKVIELGQRICAEFSQSALVVSDHQLSINVSIGSAICPTDCNTPEELLSNAFKFSKPGTPVKCTAVPEGKVLKIVIADQGRGMKAENLKNIAAYVQFDRRQHEQQGSGLGLVIAKRLIELHGGTITMESTENVGTTVTVRLPVPA